MAGPDRRNRDQSIARLRIESTKALLASDVGVTEAALAWGFTTSQSVPCAFRREAGQSPSDAQRATLTIAPLRDGLPDDPVVFDAANLGLTGTGEGSRSGLTLTNVQSRPDGRALAVNDNTGGRVAFFGFEAGERPTLSAWGAPITTGPDPFVGRFTPNGRFSLTSEWGREFAAADLDGRLPTRPGTLGVTPLDKDGRHERVGEIATNSNPDGIVISPDGRLVATVNMRSTLFPGQPASPARPQ